MYWLPRYNLLSAIIELSWMPECLLDEPPIIPANTGILRVCVTSLTLFRLFTDVGRNLLNKGLKVCGWHCDSWGNVYQELPQVYCKSICWESETINVQNIITSMFYTANNEFIMYKGKLENKK